MDEKWGKEIQICRRRKGGEEKGEKEKISLSERKTRAKK